MMERSPDEAVWSSIFSDITRVAGGMMEGSPDKAMRSSISSLRTSLELAQTFG
jgi:hypothetical protein